MVCIVCSFGHTHNNITRESSYSWNLSFFLWLTKKKILSFCTPPIKIGSGPLSVCHVAFHNFLHLVMTQKNAPDVFQGITQEANTTSPKPPSYCTTSITYKDNITSQQQITLPCLHSPLLLLLLKNTI